MWKRLLIIAISMLMVVGFADVTISVPDLDQKIMRVTYTIVDKDAGDTGLVFPNDGYDFAAGDIKVISVTELNTEQELEYKIVRAPKNESKQAVDITYPNPVPKGGSFKIQVTVEAPSKYISKDSKGRYVFSYSTSHPNLFFVLPKGHAIVYANYPVLVYEKKGHTVVQVHFGNSYSDKVQKVIFKTRAFPTGH